MGVPHGALRLGRAALFFLAPAVWMLASGCSGKTVAIVNGDRLSEAEFAKLCETTSQIVPQQGTVGMQVLFQWINSAVRAQRARELKVYPTEADVRSRLEVFRKRAAFVGVDFDMSLRQRGMNEETLKREILEALIFERVMFHGVSATDAEIEAMFQRNRQRFAIPAQVRISQITVESKDALQRAQNELNGNAQFAVVAQTYSKDMFKDAGGVVPAALSLPVQPGGAVAADVVAAAFKLKEGQISEPLKIGATWVIVRLDEKIEAKEPKLEDFKELVRGEVLQQKAETSGRLGENQASILRAVQSAQITVNRPEYQGIGEMMKQALAQGVAPGPGGAPIPASAPGAVTPGHEGHDHGPLPPPPPGG